MEDKLDNSISKKTLLEEEKLSLEIAELKKSWHKKPAFFVPFFGTISSLFILWISGFFDTRIQKLSFERSQLTIETQNLEKIKKGLVKDSTDLKNATNQIGKQYKKLKIQNDSLIADFMAKKQELSEVKEKLSIANKPVVEVYLQKKWSDKKVGISIINNGTGTAFIKTLMYVYNDKNFIGDSKNSYANLLGEMYEESNFPVFEYFGYNSVNDISKANALKSGSEKFIILLKKYYNK